MAGNVKFESSSGSPVDSGFTGSFPNGQRGPQPAASLNTLGSFRENSDGRAFSFGSSMSKGNVGDLPPLSQCLILDQIMLGKQKYTRSGELRRALGFSSGSIHDDKFFGAAHSKLAPTLASEEMRRFRGSLLEGNVKARIRVKRLSDDYLNKLNKYLEVHISRKQQTNERLSRSTLLKAGTQAQRKSLELMTQKFNDRGKNVLSRCARTPIGDMRAEGRDGNIRRQHMMLAKHKDMSKGGSLSSNPVEEKIRRLPAGGESWDRNMKRKRSVSNAFPRPIDGDGDTKKAMPGRVSNDSGSPFSDGHAFRSVSSNGVSGITMPYGTSSAFVSSDHPLPKSESEKVLFSREHTGMNKERTSQKGSNKLNVGEESHLASPSLVTKGKASWPPRTGPPMTGSSTPNFSCMSGTPEDSEQSPNASKIHPLGGINSHKRAMPSESSYPPMAEWVGQRPQKISRTRRTNIISPTTNHDEALVSSEGCIASDIGSRTSSGGSVPFPARNMASNMLPLKIKRENTSSPAQLAESEESTVVEMRMQERTVGGVEVEERALNGYYHAGSSGFLTNRSKLVHKEETGDGVRRQGCSGRGSSFPQGNMSLLGEKLDTPPIPKPIRSSRPGFEKNRSKSGRPPLKKHSEHKGFMRLSLVQNGNSPDCTGESDDDREELLQAMHLACYSSYHACSSAFWKKMEPLYSLRSDDKSFLMQQLKYSVEHRGSLAQTCDLDCKDCVKDFLHDKSHQPQGFGMESAKSEDDVNQGQNSCFAYRRDSENQSTNIIPLYQRVLSALIVDDELEEGNGGPHTSFWSGRDNHCQMGDTIICNGGSPCHSGHPDIYNFSRDELESDCNFTHSETGISPAPFQKNMNGVHTSHIKISSDSSSEGQHAQMSIDGRLLIELQSIGLYLESVPDLAEGEDEVFNKDFLELKKQLCHHAEKKKACLERLNEAFEGKKEAEDRALKQVAMNELIELAYKKLLATRGSIAARLGVSKVPRHVALAFVRRTVARCQKFEDTGKSCFIEHTIRDVLLARSPSCSDAETINCNASMDRNIQPEVRLPGSQSAGAEHLGLQSDKPERGLFDLYDPLTHQADQNFAINGPILNGGKKKEVLLDDVSNSTALRSSSPPGNAFVGGTKGKMSERDRDRDQLSKDSGPKSGFPSINNLQGDRKGKSKPKQKAAQLSTHSFFPSAVSSSELVANCSNRKREGLTSPSNIVSSSKESKDPANLTNLPLHDIDSIEELGMDNEFGAYQDLSSWLNFEEDNLLDHDSMGLEIPMDDLSELNMLL